MFSCSSHGGLKNIRNYPFQGEFISFGKYFLWSNCTEIALRGKALWEIVSSSALEPIAAVYENSYSVARHIRRKDQIIT